MRKYDKQRLFEMMNKVDKRFKLNENFNNDDNNVELNNNSNDNEEDNDPNYISFEVDPNSEDYNLLKKVVDIGLKSEPFRKSEFSMKDYDDGRITGLFKFHISEKPLLLQYLNQLDPKNNNEFIRNFTQKVNDNNNNIKEENLNHNNKYDEYVKFYEMSKDISGESFSEYEELSNKLFGNYLLPDVEFALNYFETGDDFADYLINKGGEGNLLTPMQPLNKTDKESEDFFNTYRKK